MRTYIVVPVFHQEGYSLALCALSIRVPLQLVLGSSDIVDQLPIGEGPARERVYDGGTVRMVLLDGFEDGEAGQC